MIGGDAPDGAHPLHLCSQVLPADIILYLKLDDVSNRVVGKIEP